jgi:DnaJ homolog subfamily C member 28
MNVTRTLSHHRTLARIQRPSIQLWRFNSNHAPQADHRASAKLFQDAASEEAEEAEQVARANRLNALETRHENWTGEESMQDAVLRMLVDKYKPLRDGPIRTADEKLKKAPPRVNAVGSGSLSDFRQVEEEERVVVQTTWGPSSRSMADVPLLPSIEGHEPWHTTFTVPSHAQSSIKYGNIPPSVSTRSTPPPPLDDKARQLAREAKKRTEQAGRLRNAKESTLDYKLGIKSDKTTNVATRRRPNPIGLKGWASLVEDRIEVCLV